MYDTEGVAALELRYRAEDRCCQTWNTSIRVSKIRKTILLELVRRADEMNKGANPNTIRSSESGDAAGRDCGRGADCVSRRRMSLIMGRCLWPRVGETQYAGRSPDEQPAITARSTCGRGAPRRGMGKTGLSNGVKACIRTSIPSRSPGGRAGVSKIRRQSGP